MHRALPGLRGDSASYDERLDSRGSPPDCSGLGPAAAFDFDWGTPKSNSVPGPQSGVVVAPYSPYRLMWLALRM